MKEILVIMLGGGCGAATRYLISLWAAERWGTAFPYGTLIVNLGGCLIIGIFTSLAAERLIFVPPSVRLLVTVGFLGGLTTFSSFGYETLQLMQSNDLTGAFANAAFNVIGGFFAAWLGMALVKWI